MSDHNRFAGVKRGRALRGRRRIAQYVLDDPEAEEIVSALPRDEYGLVMIGRELVGYSNWLDLALMARAQTAKGCRRRSVKAEAVTA